jgi:hyperosmotically inducible protein
MRIIFFMMVAVALLQGCASGVAAGYGQGGRDTYGRTYQEARADNRITAAVNSALVREALPALNIDVQTLNGVVTLSGRVTDYEVALRAAAVARNVPGVKEVRNQMRIAR